MPIPPLPLGSRRKLTGGYFAIKTPNGWVSEHIYVVEQALGRKLAENERVHFKNGIIPGPTIDDLEIRLTAPPTKFNLERRRGRLLHRLERLNHERDELINLIVPVNRKLGRADHDFTLQLGRDQDKATPT